MDEIKIKEHISEQVWKSVGDDSVDLDTYMEVLEHTSSCMYCADKLACYMEGEQTQILEPPAYLEDEIRNRVSQTKVQVAEQVKRTSNKVQLMLYGFKVGFAVAVSIFMIAVMPVFQNTEFIQVPQKDLNEKTFIEQLNENTNAITQKMNELSNIIINGGKR